MNIASIHDKLESFLNKMQKITFDGLNTIHFPTWDELKENAKKIRVEPGWAIYFVREKDYIDHIAIIPHQDEANLNLFDALLLNAAPPPIGLGIGPLTDNLSDKSGLRIITAIEYIELFKTGAYKKIFFGPPPASDNEMIKKAGLIAKEISDSGIIDNQPVVYSFSMIPLIKKFYAINFDPIKSKTKLAFITRRLKKTVKAIYCGSLVAQIWLKAGILDLPEVKFLKIRGHSSFTLFKWSQSKNSILGGLSWDNDWD
ncbi:MAG: hypothetical protein ACD_12C00029G0002 [uncultured bacterium]|nr:MAG: hypothetical protein ACD_12C00029G0002 [uncultured bacterium]